MAITNGIISGVEPANSNSLKTLLVPATLERDWDWVEPLLNEIDDICNPDWDAQQVRNQIESGDAQLWTSWDSGFAVTQVKVEPFTAQTYFLIWICHVGQRPFTEEDFGLLHQYAKDIGCSWVELWSPRKGMQRHMEGHGFEVTNTVMRRQL